MNKLLYVPCSFALLLLLAIAAPAAEPVPVKLAEDGRALLPIVVQLDASEQVRRSAASLAEYLGRITGGTFEVREANGGDAPAISVGTFTHFPRRAPTDRDEPPSIDTRARYLLRSGPDGLDVLGASDLAVRNAVWELLYVAGYRLFFPTATWEIVPSDPNLAVMIDRFDSPCCCRARSSSATA